MERDGISYIDEHFLSLFPHLVPFSYIPRDQINYHNEREVEASTDLTLINLNIRPKKEPTDSHKPAHRDRPVYRK